MIKAGRVYHGLVCSLLCASQHVCRDASSRCAVAGSCMSAAVGEACVCICVCVRCWYQVAFLQCRQHLLVLVPRGVVLADRQGSGGPVVLSPWLTCLLLHGGDSCSEPHTCTLAGERAIIAARGIGQSTTWFHTQEMKLYVQTISHKLGFSRKRYEDAKTKIFILRIKLNICFTEL